MDFVEANGLKMMTERAGEGPRLLYISGTESDLRLATKALNSPLVGHFEVLGYDQRGLGQTDKPAGPYTMADYANDAAALMDAVGWERAHVVGYSFGGMVAQEFAIRFPDRVDRLVLAATASGGAGGASFPLHELRGLSAYDKARRGIEISDLSFTREWQRENPKEAEKRIATKLERQAMFVDEPGHLDGQRAQIDARANHNTYLRLPEIKAKTLVCAGTRDGTAPMAAARAMADQIKDCRLMQFEGSHQMSQENPAVFQAIIEFLKAS